MKATNSPSLKIAPDVRRAPESMLESSKSRASVVAQSVRRQMRQRRKQRRFLERGLASRDAALISGDYYSASDVLRELDDIIATAEAMLRR